MRNSRTQHLWGGGFDAGMHPALQGISYSLQQDLPLAAADLDSSAAWAAALAGAGVLSAADAERLEQILGQLRQDLVAGHWIPTDAEDIHTAIEVEVTRRLGELGQRLHTGRSRNDQVATAFRMAVREQADWVLKGIRELERALVRRAEEEIDTLLPAYTHLQRAQPVRLAHWLLAHFWALERDVERVAAARRRADVLPLGSGAGMGNAFGVDRQALAARLGFAAVSDNSLDAVGDRDFAVEIAFACAVLALHLSRLAEELVVWSTAEFGFVRWPDALATGSSLMPNKKNPDLAELVRARSAAAVGDVVSLLVLIKSLPTSYQRDLQEDKPPVWRTTQAVGASLGAMEAAIEGIEFVHERMRAALSDDVLATEVADALVRRGVAFRAAHAAVARAVAIARQRHVALRELEASELPEPLELRDLAGLDFESAVDRRTAPGGTARSAVLAQLEAARAALGVAR